MEFKQHKTPAGPSIQRKDSVQVEAAAVCRCICHLDTKQNPSLPPSLEPSLLGERRAAPIILCERCVANFIMLPIDWFDQAGSSGRLTVCSKQRMRGDEVTREGKKQDEGDVTRGRWREPAVGEGRPPQMRASDLKYQRMDQSAGWCAHAHAATFAQIPFFFSPFCHSTLLNYEG